MGWLIDQELFFFVHNGPPGNERCPLADAGSLEDNERMVYAMKIERQHISKNNPWCT